MSEQRRYLRTRFDSRVLVQHPTAGSAVFRTRDVSDGGVYLQKGEFSLAIGDLVIVQIQDVPVEAPRMRMQVMREDAGGYGLQFAE